MPVPNMGGVQVACNPERSCRRVEKLSAGKNIVPSIVTSDHQHHSGIQKRGGGTPPARAHGTLVTGPPSTVNGTALLVSPSTVTTTLPLVALRGTEVVIGSPV